MVVLLFNQKRYSPFHLYLQCLNPPLAALPSGIGGGGVKIKGNLMLIISMIGGNHLSNLDLRLHLGLKKTREIIAIFHDFRWLALSALHVLHVMRG